MMSRMIAVAVLMKLAAAQADIIVPTSSNAYFTIVRTTTGGRTTFSEARSYNEERLLTLKSLACPSPSNPGHNKCQGRVHFFPPHFDRLDLPEPVNGVPYGYAKVTEQNPSVATIDLSLWGNTPVFVADLLTEWRSSTREPLRFVPTTRGSALATAQSVVTSRSGRKGLEVEFNIFRSNVCSGCTNHAGDCTGCPEGVSTMRFYLLMSAILKPSVPSPPTSGKLELISSHGGSWTEHARLQVQTYDNRPAASLGATRVAQVVSLPSGTWASLNFQPKRGRADVTGYSRLVVGLRCDTNVVVEINVGREEEGGMWNAAKQSCGLQWTTISVPLPSPRPRWMKKVNTLAWALFSPYNNGGYIRNTKAYFSHSYFE